jgi:hypothetical protein
MEEIENQKPKEDLVELVADSLEWIGFSASLCLSPSLRGGDLCVVLKRNGGGEIVWGNADVNWNASIIDKNGKVESSIKTTCPSDSQDVSAIVETIKGPSIRAGAILSRPDELTTQLITEPTKKITESKKINTEPGLGFGGNICVFLLLLLFFGVPAILIWSMLPYSITEPIKYRAIYQVEFGQVLVDRKPTDCNWDHAPIGNIDCHYKKQVDTVENEHGQVIEVYVSWVKVTD